MKSLPDLEAWAIFAKVAEAGSFARAATELSLSQATVSKAIARLEQRVDATLFHRTPRSISLTDTGLAALERATHILEEGEAIEAEVAERSSSLRGPIRVSAPMSFGIARLAPLLPAFLQAHPGVELDIQCDDRQVDLVANRFDLALRLASLVDSSLLTRRLCGVRILLVGAPAYFSRHGRPTHPCELAQHHGLHYSYSRHGLQWRFRHPRLGDYSQQVPIALQSNNAEMLTPALLAGLGVALQPAFLAWSYLESGELEQALPQWRIDPVVLHIVMPPGRRRPARVQALIDYLAQQLAHAPWAEPLQSVDSA